MANNECEMRFRTKYNIAIMQSRTVHNIIKLLDRLVVKKDLSDKKLRDYQDLCDMHDESTYKMTKGYTTRQPTWLYNPRKIKQINKTRSLK